MNTRTITLMVAVLAVTASAVSATAPTQSECAVCLLKYSGCGVDSTSTCNFDEATTHTYAKTWADDSTFRSLCMAPLSGQDASIYATFFVYVNNNVGSDLCVAITQNLDTATAASCLADMKTQDQTACTAVLTSLKSTDSTVYNNVCTSQPALKALAN